MKAADRRGLRGVVIHMVRREPAKTFCRDMVGSFYGGKRTGRCVWCDQLLAALRHPERAPLPVPEPRQVALLG